MTVSGKTRVICILGDPVSHSASPRMQNAALRSAGIDMVYVPCHVKPDHLRAAVNGLRAMNCVGANITIPHKEDILPFLDSLDPLAEAIGAVNTVVVREGELIGYNTDGPGFVLSLKQHSSLRLSGAHVVILGAGGSARALAYSLLQEELAALSICNRNLSRAEALVNALKGSRLPINACALSGSETRKIIGDADVVINTTSVGMAPNINETPVDVSTVARPEQYYCDIIYTPVETSFLKAAAARGATCIDGRGMLAGQGRLSFQLFTGMDVSFEELYKEV